jgi:hypothetical protein
MLCGEISHRINYEKDDKIEKKNPSLGDLNFTLKEAYPLSAILPQVSKSLKIKMKYEDDALGEKVSKIYDIAQKHKGALPVAIELHYTDGTVVDIDLGPLSRVDCNMEFLAEIAKIVPQGDTTFSPCEKIYFAPPEEKRFSKSFS